MLIIIIVQNIIDTSKVKSDEMDFWLLSQNKWLNIITELIMTDAWQSC